MSTDVHPVNVDSHRAFRISWAGRRNRPLVVAVLYSPPPLLLPGRMPPRNIPWQERPVDPGSPPKMIPGGLYLAFFAVCVDSVPD